MSLRGHECPRRGTARALVPRLCRGRVTSTPEGTPRNQAAACCCPVATQPRPPHHEWGGGAGNQALVGVGRRLPPSAHVPGRRLGGTGEERLPSTKLTQPPSEPQPARRGHSHLPSALAAGLALPSRCPPPLDARHPRAGCQRLRSRSTRTSARRASCRSPAPRPAHLLAERWHALLVLRPRCVLLPCTFAHIRGS